MTPDVSIRGAHQLAEVSARLKAAGRRDLNRELLGGIRKAAAPLKRVAQESARTNLPKHGGLNEIVAASQFGIRTRTSGRSPGVRVIARSQHDIGAMDRGLVRHPDYPRGPRSEWKWSGQRIRPGWYTGALTAEAPAIRVQILRSMNRVAERVAHG